MENIQSSGSYYLRFVDSSPRTTEVVFVDLRYYQPSSEETLISWDIVDGDRDPYNYLRDGKSIQYSPVENVYDPSPNAPNPKLFITTLKNSPQFPLEFMPYLNMWTEADILNDVNRKAFWAKVKNSGAYFLTPEIIQAVEDLAIQCNLPLE